VSLQNLDDAGNIFRGSLLAFVPIVAASFSFALLVVRRRFHLLFLQTFVLFFFLFGVRPSSDFANLSPLISLVGISLGLLIRYSVSSNLRLALYLTFVFLIVFGFYTALYKNYYRNPEPIINHNTYLHSPTIQLFISADFKKELEALNDLVDKQTTKDDFVYIDAFNPLLYFILERKEPLQRSYLDPSLSLVSYYEEVVGNLVAKEVEIVIANRNASENSILDDFLNKNYYYVTSTRGFDIYFKRP
jgi:hypothetical protein